MKKLLRSLALVSLSALALSATSAFAADWVRILSMTPASPASLPGVPSGTPMGPANSIEVAFAYNLETHPTGRIGFYTAGEPGNPSHTGLEIPVPVTKGQGQGKTRFSVQCPTPASPCVIKSVRFNLFFDGPPLVKLFEGHHAVEYTFKCATVGTNPGGDRKPNVAFARPGIYIWGSNPANKHWVDWNGSVTLKAGEAINPHPTPSNGRCAFNVEYYEKETNGLATPNFKNKLYSDADERAINGPGALAASELKSIVTQPYLDSGAHSLKVVLDADGNVNETNEGDNSHSIRYILEGRCDSKPATAPAAATKK